MQLEPHSPSGQAGRRRDQPLVTLVCFLVIAAYVLMCDLKGINTDEGLRLSIINAGQPYRLDPPTRGNDWEQVLAAGQPFAYQPLYFLIQHTVMGLAQSHSSVLLKLVNIGFLWLSLQGLLALSREWRLLPRLFLLGAFSFNAYLFMHVLQIREYILGVAFYIWSTWLVLRLVERKLSLGWADSAWFAAYGILLVLGFYVQTWVVFVALGQGLYLVVWRQADRWRFYAHLALSYQIVLIATLPYLHTNNQRVDVGRWGREGSELLPQLSDGFRLVLTGHLSGHSAFTSFLFWFWLAVMGGAGALLMGRQHPTVAPESLAAIRREAPLMLLSMACPLLFQIGYFYRLDNLSVWPRYFIIHYFFLLWLLALAVRFLHEMGGSPAISPRFRRDLKASVGAILVVLIASTAYQTGSYYRDPFFDTGMNRLFNWRILAAEIARQLQPDDVLVAHELLNRSTLTFTRPVPNPVLMLSELKVHDFTAVSRVVYLEPASFIPDRAALGAQLADLGFPRMETVQLRSGDNQGHLPDWHLLVFRR